MSKSHSQFIEWGEAERLRNAVHCRTVFNTEILQMRCQQDQELDRWLNTGTGHHIQAPQLTQPIKDRTIELATATNVKIFHVHQMSKRRGANLGTVDHIQTSDTPKASKRGICEPPTPTDIELLELKVIKDGICELLSPGNIEILEILKMDKRRIGNVTAAHGQSR
jgi:hypothetical protein